MASRNNGEGPPNGKGSGDRPGSYAKIAGSRRRRRGRKQMSSTRPASPNALAEPLESELLSGGESTDESGLDEPFDPPVDDLRTQRGSGSTTPRRMQGPLGMDEPRAVASGSQPPPAVAHVRVIEINAPPRGSDNSNDGARAGAASHDDQLGSGASPMPMEPRLAHSPAEMDEPFAPSSVPPASVPPRSVPPRSVRPSARAPTAEEDRFADDEELRAASEPPPSNPDAYHDEPDEVPAARLVSHDPGHGFVMGQGHAGHGDDEVEHTPRAGFSTVFNARPSLRPSPPPPPRSTAGWWVAILMLSSIIVAAGVVAVREKMEVESQQQATARHEPPSATPAPEPAPSPADAPQPSDAPPPAPEPVVESVAVVAPADAGAKAVSDAAVVAKPARVWKPRKQIAGDAGAKGGVRAAPAPVASPPVEAVPANPYGAAPGIR